MTARAAAGIMKVVRSASRLACGRAESPCLTKGHFRTTPYSAQRLAQRRGISLDTISPPSPTSVPTCGTASSAATSRDDGRRESSPDPSSATTHARSASTRPKSSAISCRLFPNGDRRARQLIEARARIVGHKPKVDDQVGGAARRGDRRRRAYQAPSEPAKAVRLSAGAREPQRPSWIQRACSPWPAGRRPCYGPGSPRDCRRPCHPLLRRGHDDPRLLGRHLVVAALRSACRRSSMPRTGAEKMHGFDSTAAVPGRSPSIR